MSDASYWTSTVVLAGRQIYQFMNPSQEGSLCMKRTVVVVIAASAIAVWSRRRPAFGRGFADCEVETFYSC